MWGARWRPVCTDCKRMDMGILREMRELSRSTLYIPCALQMRFNPVAAHTRIGLRGCSPARPRDLGLFDTSVSACRKTAGEISGSVVKTAGEYGQKWPKSDQMPPHFYSRRISPALFGSRMLSAPPFATYPLLIPKKRYQNKTTAPRWLKRWL